MVVLDAIVRARRGQRVLIALAHMHESDEMFLAVVEALAADSPGSPGVDRVSRVNGRKEVSFTGGGRLMFGSSRQHLGGSSLDFVVTHRDAPARFRASVAAATVTSPVGDIAFV